VAPNGSGGTATVTVITAPTVAPSPVTTGDFLIDVGATVTMASPWVVGPIAPLWTTPNFHFDITNISKNFGGDIVGKGWVYRDAHPTGLDRTRAYYRFTTQGTNGSFAFSATTQAPEPASLALFGLGLAGFACSRKKKVAKQ